MPCFAWAFTIIRMSAPLGDARFDDATGAPLTAEARALLDAATKGDRGIEGGGGEGAEAAKATMDAVPTVDLAEGEWKYVAIDIRLKGVAKRIVTSTAHLKFHPDMYEAAMKKLAPLGIQGTVIGGGRVSLDHKAKKCAIWGYSKSFGRAKGCNERSAEQVREAYPDYEVTWSDDGY